ncbi:hypothetical protein MCOR25_010042 [Pyricularia grisea]|nr:hypothetical protein MCOR25_010042 [Pyricularia grisea]
MAHIPVTPNTDPVHNQVWRHIVTQREVPESFVNGFWYQVLRHYFPFPDFMICPEARGEQAQGGARADLLVRQVRLRPNTADVYDTRPILAFEGKRGPSAGQATTFGVLSHSDQLSTYISNCTQFEGLKYGILASGSMFVMMGWQRAARSDDIRQVKWTEGRPQFGGSTVVHDVNDRNHLAQLDTILKHIHRLAMEVNGGDGATHGWSEAIWPR